MPDKSFLDEPPNGPVLTTYDRKHMKLYYRLHDAAASGADWREAVRIIFGLDPSTDFERARRVHDSHLARAKWLEKQGFWLLAGEQQKPPR